MLFILYWNCYEKFIIIRYLPALFGAVFHGVCSYKSVAGRLLWARFSSGCFNLYFKIYSSYSGCESASAANLRYSHARNRQLTHRL